MRITRFEHLPNELILEIFDYTKIRDLAYGFWNLNKRFNQLIRSLQYLSLRFTKNETYEINLFSKQIIRIVIVTLAQINLNSFSNLRTLIVNWGNEYHLEQIRADILPNLIYLSLPCSFDFDAIKQLASEIFSNRFTSLRYAALGKINMSSLSSWSQSPSLRSLTIISPSINIIPHILQICTQLTHLQIRITDEHDLDLSLLPITSNYPLKQFIFIQPQTSKFIYDIRSILSIIPNLKQLDLSLCIRSFIDLIKFISEYFIDLKCFDCHIIEYPNKDERIDINLIRNIHSCYSCIQCTLREDLFYLYTNK